MEEEEDMAGRARKSLEVSVRNRLNQTVELKLGGKIYSFPPHGKLPLPSEAVADVAKYSKMLAMEKR